ncbi:thioredoxin domain-containing protein [Mycolicibacterium flavescens]|uniref:Protein-disulfide isomerase n=1 Tax=Mycolicibacterium flavescens TaxID=1776 RepID=A0A1E3RD59_MYCFV|nr:thioredoxin domain-containing protein [Mycolicibacterium flavescens]MCV7278413.1 thioredoxin domain-containing protein [Mycolicibacterium flavescens]ODQ87800.1 protein-disulfide isomerase [Mycolicibacterium flavescens]
MRRSAAVVVLALTVLLVAVGCTRQVAGTAHRDPAQPPVWISEDGYGVVAGFVDAPVNIEIFTEPQCTHCADLQADFGDQLAYYIGVGQLRVTYRPLIFLDETRDGHSARVSNALFLAADDDVTGTQFQRFVAELWLNQEPGGTGPSDDEIADMAQHIGMSDAAVRRISTGGSAVNIADMDAINFEFLYEIDNLTTGTPTVYNLTADERLDIYDNDWLLKLVQS